MKQSTKFNLNRAYKQYIKRLKTYGMNPMSKKDFEEMVKSVKTRNPRKDRKRKINTNIRLAKAAIDKQFEKMSGYDKYLAMWRRAKKAGLIKAKTPMSRERFVKEKNMLGDVKGGTKKIVQMAYQTNPKQVPALLKEAELQGFKITRFDIYKQTKRYKEFLKLINKKGGWIEFDAAYYEDLKYAGTTEEEMGDTSDLYYDEEEDAYVLPF